MAPVKTTCSTLGGVSVTKAIIGHILTLMALVAGIAMSYGELYSRVEGLDARVTSLENDVMPLLREIQRDVGDVKVELATVKANVEWLKQDKNEISK